MFLYFITDSNPVPVRNFYYSIGYFSMFVGGFSAAPLASAAHNSLEQGLCTVKTRTFILVTFNYHLYFSGT